MGGDIYKIGLDLIIWRCVREDEMHEIMKANHDGPCRGHFLDKRCWFALADLGLDCTSHQQNPITLALSASDYAAA